MQKIRLDTIEKCLPVHIFLRLAGVWWKASFLPENQVLVMQFNSRLRLRLYRNRNLVRQQLRLRA
jgi:hypothetical protein